MYHVHAANVSAIPTDMDTGDAPGDLLHGKGVVFKPGKVVFFFVKNPAREVVFCELLAQIPTSGMSFLY